ncbi:ribonuclease Z [Phaeodactylibacter xiamenensis]|uniref:ribonuclease Z n=1 Tax=Phaeodactylibacter xiamenensis TaxID=1524460 RepID=UPI0024A96668|nr:ribonuclease Z [Phaeodactylibacter xiamenensis]
MRFDLTILGCSGAVPAYRRFPTMQLLNVQEQLFMIDCGEGAQMRFSDFSVKWGKLSHIFISHHHGDHVLGLPGLLSSMGLNHRTSPLTVFGPPKVGAFLEQACSFSEQLSFPVHFESVDPDRNALVYESRHLRVYSLPLRHSVPATGYLFQEKERPRSMRGELIEKYQIPYQAIPGIRNGDDFVSSVHGVIPNGALTIAPPAPRSFAFCSDTAYQPSLTDYIYGVDLLYHEATFLQQHEAQAKETGHSTAKDAARTALEANAGTLLLGHYSTRYPVLDRILQEAVSVFPNTILGSDGLIVPLTTRPGTG